jgi:hypothetical protein
VDRGATRAKGERRLTRAWWPMALFSCTALLLVANASAGSRATTTSAVLGVSQSFGAFNTSTTGATASLTASPDSATTSGDLLVATIRVRNSSGATVTGVTDSANNTWAQATAVATSQADEELWYVAGATSVSSVTVTLSAPSALAFTVIDVTGGTSGLLDVYSSAHGSGTAASTGSTSPTSASDEIAVADLGWNSSVTPSGQTSGYTTQTGVEQSNVSSLATGEQAAWQMLSSTGAQGYGATLSSSVAWTGAIATFELGASATPSPTPSTVPHIMLIVDENEEYSDLIGNSNAPYLNSLASKYTLATNWYAVEHNSPTDYLDLLSGSDQGLGGTTMKKPPFSATLLVDELHKESVPWKAYMESMTSNCQKGGSTGLYDSNHNPFHYFSSYASYCSSGSSEGVVPYPGPAALVNALDGSNAPDFVFISPNDCDNMHGGASGTFCYGDSKNQLITLGDTWLKNNVGAVLGSSWFSHNGVIILTWDEGTSRGGLAGSSAPDDQSCAAANNNTKGCGGHIVTLVLTGSPSATFTSGGDHYGTLRGLEEAYGVGLLGHTGGTADGDLYPAFGLGSSTTGSIAGQVTDQTDPSHPAVAGAQVTCSCAGGIVTSTDTSGDYSFNAVPAGSGYGLTFSASGYTTESISNVSVTAGSTTNENEVLPETGGVVYGEVTNANGGSPIGGATVTCNCSVAMTATSAADGNYSFDEVSPGTGYTLSASAPGFITESGVSVPTVNGGAAVQVDASLSPSPSSLGVVQAFGAFATSSSGPVSSLTASTSTATGSGDLLVATIRDRNTSAPATVAGVTDSAGNPWTKATALTKGQADEEIYYAQSAASVNSVTVTLTAASALAFSVVDITGASSDPLDVTSISSGSGTTATTGTTSPTAEAAEIAVADLGWNASVTPSGQTAGYTTQTGWEQSTVSGEAAGEQAAWEVLSSTGPQSYGATLSSSVAWTAAIATFKGA